MLAVDTNVLIRFLLADDPDHYQRAKAVLVRLQHDDKTLFVPQMVVQELVWQLEYHFKHSRLEIVRMVDGLFTMPLFDVEAPSRIAAAIRIYEEQAIDFTDAILIAISSEKGLEGVLSFDRDMGRLGARWVRP